VLHPKIGRVGPTCQAGLACNLARQPSFLLTPPLDIMKICSGGTGMDKLVELISNKHLSSISLMKCRYDGGKYMHFMTAKSIRTHPTPA
jgi:hypothetical protein